MEGKYLNYNDYVDLGGKLSESAFSNYITEAEVKLDYLTFNRLKNYDTIPVEVKLLIVKFISILNDFTSVGNNTQALSSYSNGIESFSYNNSQDPEKFLNNKLGLLATEYLSEYPDLINRGVYRK